MQETVIQSLHRYLHRPPPTVHDCPRLALANNSPFLPHTPSNSTATHVDCSGGVAVLQLHRCATNEQPQLSAFPDDFLTSWSVVASVQLRQWLQSARPTCRTLSACLQRRDDCNRKDEQSNRTCTG